MFNCQNCKRTVPAGIKAQRIIVRKPGTFKTTHRVILGHVEEVKQEIPGQIDKELLCCDYCFEGHSKGIPLPVLAKGPPVIPEIRGKTILLNDGDAAALGVKPEDDWDKVAKIADKIIGQTKRPAPALLLGLRDKEAKAAIQTAAAKAEQARKAKPKRQVKPPPVAPVRPPAKRPLGPSQEPVVRTEQLPGGGVLYTLGHDDGLDHTVGREKYPAKKRKHK